MSEKLIISSSPHIRKKVDTSSIMLDVIIAMSPALIASVLIFGVRALMMVVLCVTVCVGAEGLFEKAIGKESTIWDLSAVVTGMLLAFNLPVNLPFWMAIFGSIVAIIVVKQLFGGIGQNFANPAITARVVMLISFTQAMTTWKIPGTDVIAGATPLWMMSNGATDQLPSITQMFLGQYGGCIGETSSLALILGGAYLLYKKVITWHIPVTFLATAGILAVIMGVNPVYHLLSGGILIGSIFMATDYSTSPSNEKGKIIFAIGCGVITMLIRVYGNYPEGVSFAILLMNIVTPHINSLTTPKVLGGNY